MRLFADAVLRNVVVAHRAQADPLRGVEEPVRNTVVATLKSEGGLEGEVGRLVQESVNRIEATGGMMLIPPAVAKSPSCGK